MSIACKFATAAEARKGNWFSRRHQTSEAHRDASDARKDRIQAQQEGTMDRVAKQDEDAALRRAKLADKDPRFEIKTNQAIV